MLEQLRGAATSDVLNKAAGLAKQLRANREFAMLARVGEAVGRHTPENALVRSLYAQALIETGHATAAVDVLRPLARRLSRSEKAWSEAQGLIGRAHKQVFFDAGDKQSAPAREALKQSIAAYQEVMKAGGSWTWQGINCLLYTSPSPRDS